MSAAQTPESRREQELAWLRKTLLVEEVPGVPENERWYLWRNRVVEEHFSTKAEGEAYCAERGIIIDLVERFEP